MRVVLILCLFDGIPPGLKEARVGDQERWVRSGGDGV